MGAYSSSESVARAREAAELQRQRAALEAEKRRLEQVALAQHWAEMRLQEEKRQKEAIEKWRREEQQKANSEIQREMEELKMLLLQMERQEQVSGLAATNTLASTSLRETVPVQQKVVTTFGAGKASDTPSLATVAPSIRPAATSKPQVSLQANEVTVSEPSSLPKAKSQANKKNPLNTWVDASDVRYEEWSIVDYVAEENGLNKDTAATVMRLLDEYNVSFISKFRREMTHGMKEDELQNVKRSYERAKVIRQNAKSIIKEVDKQGRWTPQLRAVVLGSKSLRELDRLDLIFNVTKTRDVGCEKIAETVVQGKGVLRVWRG